VAYPYNADTALDPRTWLQGGEAVPASEQSMLPAGSRVLVSGAGTAGANGIYFPTGEIDERPVYSRSAAGVEYTIFWEGDAWALDGGSPLYNTSDSGDNPWDGTWGAIGGDTPAPTVTEFNP
jgi:hypothetical protein